MTDIAAIRARRAAVSDAVARMAMAYTEADAAFIAAAPADIDTLLAMVDALTGESESHRKDAEWLNAKWVQENNAVAARPLLPRR